MTTRLSLWVSRPADRVLRRIDWARWRAPVRLGLSVLGLTTLVVVFVGRAPGFDFYAYWAVDPSNPYRVVDGLGAFHYAPPLVWLAGPLRYLSFEAGYVMWTAVMVGLLMFMTRSWALAWCAFPPVASELFHGNVHLLIAAALVVGFRYSAVWAVLPLAKVTTGVILIWPLVRREWGRLAVAVGSGVVVFLLSLAIQGVELWTTWIDHLAVRSAQPEDGGALIDVSLLLRLPMAIAIAMWGSRTNRSWSMPVAVTLAMPLLWFHSFAVLVALQATWGIRPGREAARPTG